MNNAIIMGRLVSDAREVAVQNGGKPFHSFRLAVNSGADKTTFVDVGFFGSWSEKRAAKMVKGAGVMVQGELQPHTYTDKNTGAEKRSVQVRAFLAETDMGGNMAAVIIGGNLTGDPEVKMTQNGRKVVNFSIAYNFSYYDKKTKELVKPDPYYFDIEAWDKTGEFIAQYFHKGDAIVINGTLHSREFDGRDGSRQVRYSIRADQATFGYRRENNQQSNHNQQPAQQYGNQQQSYSVPDAYAGGDGLYGVDPDEDLAF